MNIESKYLFSIVCAVALCAMSACSSSLATYRPNLGENDRATAETMGVVQEYYNIANDMSLKYCFDQAVRKRNAKITKEMFRCIPFKYNYVRERIEVIGQLISFNNALFVLSQAKDAERFKAAAQQVGSMVKVGSEYISNYSKGMPIAAQSSEVASIIITIANLAGELGAAILEAKTEKQLSRILSDDDYFEKYGKLVDVLIKDIKKSRLIILESAIGKAYIESKELEQYLGITSGPPGKIEAAIKEDELLKAQGQEAAKSVFKFERIIISRPELALVGMKQANAALNVYAKSEKTEADKKALEAAMAVFTTQAAAAKKSIEVIRE